MPLNLKEAIQHIESGLWLSLSFITADLKKGTGGKLVDVPKCRIARNPAANKQASLKPREVQRNANHSFNMTRNVELANKRIITIHPLLVTQINNQPVI
jgi:hypothetical protein